MHYCNILTGDLFFFPSSFAFGFLGWVVWGFGVFFSEKRRTKMKLQMALRAASHPAGTALASPPARGFGRTVLMLWLMPLAMPSSTVHQSPAGYCSILPPYTGL